MTCRYCGEQLKSHGATLWSKFGNTCKGSPTSKHIALAEGMLCVYCGEVLTPRNAILWSKFGMQCKNSPTKKHCLQS